MTFNYMTALQENWILSDECKKRWLGEVKQHVSEIFLPGVIKRWRFSCFLIMKSSLFSKRFANGPPKWRHFEQDCHQGHRNSNTSLGGKEKDAFLPSFRNIQMRGQETPHLLLASLYIKMLLQTGGTAGRDKEMSGLRTWKCLPPRGWREQAQPEAVQGPHTGRENPEGKCWVQ